MNDTPTIDQRELAVQLMRMMVLGMHSALQDPGQLFGPQPANTEQVAEIPWWPMVPHFAPPSEMQKGK